MANNCEYHESVFANLRDDTNLCNRYIRYAVHTVFEAVEYGLGVNNVTLHSRKCVASDRRDLEHFIHNLVRPFDSYRRLAMVIVALIYIERARSHLKQHDIHRTIFLSAMMLATKYTNEKYISNRDWKYYAGASSQQPFNKAQAALFHSMKCDLSIADWQMLHHIKAMQTYEMDLG